MLSVPGNLNTRKNHILDGHIVSLANMPTRPTVDAYFISLMLLSENISVANRQLENVILCKVVYQNMNTCTS